ncbi:DUF502 domain-containing protein [Salinispira pacifica]|uniref:DUF502 domain-containing protein n=1 Tax=Salinispira pacifica TaxID=1307761 RepID=V5WFG3_9SPIO|nr:DUF502 domain-containing protein [Salinispira pacifica]AHC13921.1 hypothetical protein L21SP2_0489 [Salinispira pacifica]
MKRLSRFISTIFIGGVAVIFPLAVLFFFFTWLFRLVSQAVLPVALKINEWLEISVSLASAIAVILILAGCFVIGLIVKTKFGNFIHNRLERHILRRVPGYNLLREAAKPFFNTERNEMFTRPALIRPYDNETMMTAFITDHHVEKGFYTAFVPTSPNPTNGLVFHVTEDRVDFLDTGFEETMRSVVAGGNGTGELMNKIRKTDPEI